MTVITSIRSLRSSWTPSPAPDVDVDGPLQMLANTLDYDDYVGRIVVGRIVRGTIKNGQMICLMHDDQRTNEKIGRLYTYEG